MTTYTDDFIMLTKDLKVLSTKIAEEVNKETPNRSLVEGYLEELRTLKTDLNRLKNETKTESV